MPHTLTAFGWRPLWAALVLLLMPALAGAAEPPAGQELAHRIQERYRQVNSLTSDYQRTSVFVAAAGQGESKVVAQGRIYWARPLKLRLEQSEPRQELVVADGKNVWWVKERSKRADVYPIAEFTSGFKALLDVLGGLANLDDSFRVKAPEPGDTRQGLLTLVLEPLTTRADLGKLVIWVRPDDLTLMGFAMISLVGDVNTYQFADPALNQAIPAGTFEFNPPAGFRVMDHRPESMEQAPSAPAGGN
ncbi:MAG: outer membrane lipoprotein carrier protein LolA [Deltaproteobacteria bacterium]|nr:outer membrane lipoprotein carrier protein LolA [Deltaproteobacteria bacterium]